MTADWTRYNLPAINGMMQGENDCRRADRVKSWESITEAVRDQHRRLTAASTELAAVWSTRTESAQAFQRQLSGLALSMEETLKCAEDTRIGYRDVVNTLGEASAKLFKLSQGRAEVSDDLIPRGIDGAEDEYDEKAHQLMAEVEAAVAVQSANIKAPSLFSMKSNREGEGTDIGGDPPSLQPFDTGSSVQATPIPVSIPHDPLPLDPGSGIGSGVGVGAGAGAGAGGGTSTDPSLGVGPGLSGVTPTPPPPVLPGPTTITPGQPLVPGSPGLPGPVGGGPFGGGPIGPIPGTTGLGVLPGLGGLPGRGGAGAGRQSVPMRQGLPSGAVIGQSPLGAGSGGAAGRGAAGRGAAGGGAAGRGVAGQMPMAGAGNRGRRGDGSDSTIDGNPDERWEVYEGVAPVIEPDVTPARRDPGPGVFGIDR